MHPHNTNVFESNIIEKKKTKKKKQPGNQVYLAPSYVSKLVGDKPTEPD